MEKDQLKIESHPNVEGGMGVVGVFRLTFCLRASLRCRSDSSGEGGGNGCVGFKFSTFILAVYCGGMKAVQHWGVEATVSI